MYPSGETRNPLPPASSPWDSGCRSSGMSKKRRKAADEGVVEADYEIVDDNK